MEWKEFESEVVRRLGSTPKPIELAYKFCGEAKVIVLESESEWKRAISCICVRMARVRKIPVAIEVKNLVSFHFLNSKN